MRHRTIKAASSEYLNVLGVFNLIGKGAPPFEKSSDRMVEVTIYNVGDYKVSKSRKKNFERRKFNLM